MDMETGANHLLMNTDVPCMEMFLAFCSKTSPTMRRNLLIRQNIGGDLEEEAEEEEEEEKQIEEEELEDGIQSVDSPSRYSICLFLFGCIHKFFSINFVF